MPNRRDFAPDRPFVRRVFTLGGLETDSGRAMTPHHTKKGSRLYRYYVSTDTVRGREASTSEAPLRLSADMVEGAVVRELRRLIRAPEIVAQTVTATRVKNPALDERTVVATIRRFDDLWPALFPAEQARLVGLLVARVTVTTEGLAVDLRAGGLTAIVQEMLATAPQEDAA